MKNSAVLIVVIAAIGLSLGLLSIQHLLPAPIVITNVEYYQPNNALDNEQREELPAPDISPFYSGSESNWEEKVIHSGFDPDQVAHQELLNSQLSVVRADSDNRREKVLNAFMQDLALQHSSKSGEKNHLNSDNIRQVIENIDRQIESINKLKAHVLQQTNSTELPIEKFEQDSEKELARLQNLKQLIINASGQRLTAD